ncbi:hypothetical protein FRC17_010972 [Serendipita sp. 399]|nr:hypothetical protein FRC17_010972 [Serendipita sp. 399]
MAEVVGLVVNVISLVKLSAAIVQACYTYIKKVKHAPEEIQKTITEVSSLQSILEQLQKLSSDPDDERMPLLKSLEGQKGPFQACHDALEEIQKTLQSIKDPSCVSRRLLFPFQGKKLEELLETLEKHKQTFILAIAGDNAKAALNIQTGVKHVSNQLEDMKISELRKEILQWLKGTDPRTDHNAARKMHEPGTGEWLLDSEQFKTWMGEDRKILWLNGIPGAGKTVLSSTVIEHLVGQCTDGTDNRIVYYYFDFRSHEKQTASGCLKSILRQLCQYDAVPAAIQKLYVDCKRAEPSLSQLRTTLVDVLSDGCKYFIVIDALDECKEEGRELERKDFFEFLKGVVSSATARYSIFIASRPEVDIKRSLSELDAVDFNIQQKPVDADIRSHVRACLEKEARFKKWPSAVKTQIEDKLAAGANGMFRWAVCQLDTLKCYSSKPANALREIEFLPKTLDDTYSRILTRIPSGYQRELKTILMFLAFSTRPMTIQEVAEATAVNLESRTFSTDERFLDPYDILEHCSSLVSLADLSYASAYDLIWEREDDDHWAPEVKVIQFAHFSVKEYVLSERARQAVSASLITTPSKSCLHITEICLIYLLDFNGGKATIDFDHNEYPLLAYAAHHWMTHMASMEDSDQNAIEDLLLRLFDDDDPSNLMNCLNLYDPVPTTVEWRYGDGTRKIGASRKRNRQDFETPLYYACYYGLLPIVEALLGMTTKRTRTDDELGTALEAAASRGFVAVARRLLEESADPNATYCRRFQRPLQAAASSGSMEVVALLLEAGADVNASGGGEFGTALHAAAWQGSDEIIQLLIDNGHDINPCARNHGTPLILAAQHNHESAVLTLLKNGANPNIYRGAPSPPLDFALEDLSFNVVKALLDAGAEIQREPGKGTAFNTAAFRGDIPIMQLLIERGADINAPGEDNDTPLMAAIDGEEDDVLRFMLESGADINDCGRTSKYPVDHAISVGNLKAADRLLELGGKFGEGALENALESPSREYLVKILLDRGADPNSARKRYGNVLQLAVYQAREQAVHWLLEAGADVNVVEGEYGTALQAAVTEGNAPLVRLLLDYGADVNPPCSGEYGYPLQAAARKEEMSILRLLIDRGANVNSRGGRYETALQAAAGIGNEEAVNFLLGKGANVNIVGGNYQTALRAAAAKGHKSIVDMLLEAGADMNVTTVGEHSTASNPYSIESFSSALEVAAGSGKTEIVQALLDHGMDINADKEICSHALSKAASIRDPSMLEFLISKGANTVLCGGLAVYIATSRRNLDNLRVLIRHGANVNYCTEYGGSALQESARLDQWEIMELLLESGADVNRQGGEYGSPLQVAIESGSKQIAMELLGRGADVNAMAGKWGTALSLAAHKGDEEMIRELIQRGADINYVHGNHDSALQSAIYGNYYDIANELLDMGADPNLRCTALIAASGHGRPGQLDLFKRLLPLTTNIEAVGYVASLEGHFTALQCAAYTGNELVARLLIEAGANVNTNAGTYGYSLQAAATNGHRGMVSFLLENGADVNAVGGKFGTALQAASNEAEDTVISLLLENGADVNAVGGEFGTALQAASIKAEDTIISLLLENGADVNIEGGLYGSPLQAVCRLDAIRHVRTFLDRGARVNTNVGKYGSPLRAAAESGNLDVVKLLLERGADVNLVGGKHGTALQAACCGYSDSTKRNRIIELLLECGANVNQEDGEWGTALQAAVYHHHSYVEILLKHDADPNIKGGMFGSALKAAKYEGSSDVVKLLVQYGAKDED